MKKIFLCAPYSHPQRIVRDARALIINKVAANLINQGNIVFSPISHSHEMAQQNELPTEFEFWQIQNHEFIKWADSVTVLMLNGWKESRGVADEIEFADKIGKPVEYINV